MAVYCFKCPSCGNGGWTALSREDVGICGMCEVPLVRDYKAEGVGIGAGVRVSQSGTNREYAQKFLPTAADYAGPGDPDGSKGLRQWADEHQPKGSNPTYPEGIPRRSY